MKKEIDLNNLEQGAIKTIEEYSKMPLPDDYSKQQTLQMLTKELGLISSEKKRVQDSTLQEERFELEKDHKYWNEKFEERKFKLEEDKFKNTSKQEESKLGLEERKLNLEEEKFKDASKQEASKLELEKAKFKDNSTNEEFRRKLEEEKFKDASKNEEFRLELEKIRLDIEKSNLEFQRQNALEERKLKKWTLIFQIASFGVSTLTTIIGLCLSNKLAYDNLKLIYVDEGRPTTEFKDSCKVIRNYIKRRD